MKLGAAFHSPTASILSKAIFTLLCYSCIGMSLSVIPGFVHLGLGYSTVMAGLIVSAQYLGTFVSRPFSGHRIDTVGPKSAVMLGFGSCFISGVLLFLTPFGGRGLWALGALVLARLLLGVAESLVSTATITWNIGSVGSEHTTSIISWNGMASYGGIALGSPVGIMLFRMQWLPGGLVAVGAVTALAGALGLGMSWFHKPTHPIAHSTRLSFARVFRLVLPYGTGLALGSVGFAAVMAFITLFFNEHHWQHGAGALSLFGIAFCLVRYRCASQISRMGGLQMAILSLLAESAGLVLLAFSSSEFMGCVGAVLCGAGFSRVFPSLGVVAVGLVGPENRGSGLGAFSLFLDITLCLASPMLGFVIRISDYNFMFLSAALCAIAGAGLGWAMLRLMPLTARTH